MIVEIKVNNDSLVPIYLEVIVNDSVDKIKILPEKNKKIRVVDDMIPVITKIRLDSFSGSIIFNNTITSDELLGNCVEMRKSITYNGTDFTTDTVCLVQKPDNFGI